jgi:flagellar basal-body rod modification protein FlgD
MSSISNIGATLTSLLSPTMNKAASALSTEAAAKSDSLKSALLKAIKSDSTSDTGTDTSSTTSELGKDEFLELLVLQMQNQDPLSPTDNTEMIAQLAQFSALEQMNNLNEQFQEFSGNIDQLNFMSASSMIGKEVRGIDTDGELVEGTVDGVQMTDSVVYLTIGDSVMSMAGVETIT